MSRVLVISDLQIPFEHAQALQFCKAVARKYKTNIVVNIGDELDMHALSDYDHDPDGFSAGHELAAAIDKLKAWYRAFPKTLVCTSNHTARPLRRAKKYGIPSAYLKDYREFLQAPKGWKWYDRFEIDGVVYEHGEGFSGRGGALKAAECNMQSTVIGHLHSHAGIQYSANKRHLIFGFNVGCLVNNSAYAFDYGKVYSTKPILGVGVVINGVPLYVPMVLNRKGKWSGKL